MRITTRGGAAALTATTAVVVSVLVTGASAHIPGAGNGLAPSSAAPGLRSVSVVSATLGDGQPEQVRYCFDQAVSAASGAAFSIDTYDADRTIQGSGTPASVAADSRCVDVPFDDGLDVQQGTIGIVAAGAAKGAANGAVSFEASEPLGGSLSSRQPGRTTAPDLIGVSVDPNGASPGGTATYTFDEDIDPALPADTGGPGDPPPSRATLFSFSQDDGTIVVGSDYEGVSGDRRSVTIGFDQPVSTARVFLTRSAAVRDRPQSSARGGALTTNSAVSALATASVSRPQLSGATALGGKQFKLSYGSAVSPNGNASHIVAVTDDGRAVEAGDVGTDSTTSTVATFADLDDEDAVVRIVDVGGGVTTPDDVASVASQASVGPGAHADPGFTSAPDLLSASYDASRNQVTYRFDESVTSSGNAFFAFGPNGDKQPTSSTAYEGTTVRATYDSTAASTVGAGVALAGTGAVDVAGHRSPPSSVSYAVEQPPPAAPAAPVTSPSAPTPAPVPPRVLATRKKYRTTFSSFRIRSKTRYVGRITSSGRGCKSGRRIALKRSGKTLVNAYTRGDGTFSIKRTSRTRLKPKVYAVATERTNATLTCTAHGSKTLHRG